jgi:hypothetical protein
MAGPWLLLLSYSFSFVVVRLFNLFSFVYSFLSFEDLFQETKAAPQKELDASVLVEHVVC